MARLKGKTEKLHEEKDPFDRAIYEFFGDAMGCRGVPPSPGLAQWIHAAKFVMGLKNDTDPAVRSRGEFYWKEDSTDSEKSREMRRLFPSVMGQVEQELIKALSGNDGQFFISLGLHLERMKAGAVDPLRNWILCACFQFVSDAKGQRYVPKLAEKTTHELWELYREATGDLTTDVRVFRRALKECKATWRRETGFIKRTREG